MAELHNVPGGGEVWQVDDTWYLVYHIDPAEFEGIEGDAPIPLAYKLRNDEQIDALFGPDQQREVDYRLSRDQFNQTGAQEMGVRDEIVNENKHPWVVIKENFTREAEIRPWLKDPEIFRLVMSAELQGRSLTDAELKTTNWWRSHNEAQRQWMQLKESDPAQAATLLDDNKQKIKRQLRQAGWPDAPEDIVNHLAHHWTSGSLSSEVVNEQILALTDPFSGAELRPGLQELVEQKQHDLDITREGEDRVRQLYEQWLGGLGTPSEETVRRLAGRLRNDPDAETELVEHLRQQRLALLPEYENENLKWADIAPTWKNFIQQRWGQTIEDTDPVLHQVMRLNDAGEAEELLRKEGIRRGNKQVKRQAMRGLLEVTGGAVVRGSRS